MTVCVLLCKTLKEKQTTPENNKNDANSSYNGHGYFKHFILDITLELCAKIINIVVTYNIRHTITIHIVYFISLLTFYITIHYYST